MDVVTVTEIYIYLKNKFNLKRIKKGNVLDYQSCLLIPGN